MTVPPIIPMRGALTWSFLAYVDVPDFAEHERAGRTVEVLMEAVKTQLMQFTWSQVTIPFRGRERVLITRNPAPRSDVLNFAVVMTPREDTDTQYVGSLILLALNRGRGNLRAFVGHRSFTDYITTPSIYLPLWNRDEQEGFSQRRVVRDLRVGTQPQETHTSDSVLARAANTVNPLPMRSTDPAADGRAPLEVQTRDTIESLANTSPLQGLPTLGVIAGIAAGLAGLVVVATVVNMVRR